MKTTIFCPLNQKCKSVTVDVEGQIIETKICMWHTKLQGTNPQDGTPTEQEGCAISFLPMLLVQNSMHAQSTTAAVDSFKNEIATQGEASRNLQLQLYHFDK